MLFQQVNIHSICESYVSHTVKSVSLGKLYFVHKGRNAWHRTWIQRYQADYSVVSSLDEAKLHAENFRGQGTVCYIRELPCIVFKGVSDDGPGVLCITELETDKILTRPKNLSSWVTRSKDTIRFEDVLKLTTNSYQYWKHDKSETKNRAIISLKPEIFGVPKIEVIGAKNLKPLLYWESYSLGGEYRLGWHQRGTCFNTNGVQKVFYCLKSLLSEVPNSPKFIEGDPRVICSA